MIFDKFTIEHNKYDDFLDITRGYAKKRGFTFREEFEDSIYTFAIYDRDIRSAYLFDTVEMFVGSSLIPERIRIKGRIIKKPQAIEVNLRGDVMMNMYNYVNDRPKRRDVLRCEDLFNDFINEINSVKNN